MHATPLEVRRPSLACAVLVPGALLIAAVVTPCAAGPDADWPQFRGPTGDGISAAVGLPVTWSEKEAIAWKVPVPGLGRSSPVVMGDRIWLTTAVSIEGAGDGAGTIPGSPGEGPPRETAAPPAETPAKPAETPAKPISLRVLCYHRRDGTPLHDSEVLRVERPEPIHWLNSHATPTPVLEPGGLYCDFGTYGTVAVDPETGRVLWKVRLPIDHQLGPASSPAIWRDRLILVRDGCDEQYVAALDKRTGETAWRTRRPPIEAEGGPYKKSFSTPLVIEAAGRAQAVVPGPHWVVSYDPATGEEIWRVRHGKGYSIAPRPVFGHGMVYVSTGDYVAQLWAIRVDGRGDVTETHVAWKATSQIPLMSSTLLVASDITFVSDNGIVSCLDASSGELRWRERIGGNHAASPILADGRIYFFSREGKATVVAAGTNCVRLAENDLDGTIIASPAVAGHAIILRTNTHLYSIEKR